MIEQLICKHSNPDNLRTMLEFRKIIPHSTIIFQLAKFFKNSALLLGCDYEDLIEL